MKFSKGDKVAVIDAAIRGVVLAVHEGNNILIEDEYGFELIYQSKDLVKITLDQRELSKYSDIDNPLLKQKIKHKINPKKSNFKKHKKDAGMVTMEVDLHIEKLVKSTSGMHNFDILNKQLDTAKHKLEFAIKKRIPKIVFIHGVGEGVLQKELLRILHRYPVKISEASYREYGYGATEVYVLQKKS